VPGEIDGNCVLLSGATLTHTANDDTEAYKINLAVGGSMTVAADAKVTATGRGYAMNKGPGAAGAGKCAAASGGCSDAKDSYGSALCPTNCGSGGYKQTASYAYAGGGAVRLVVAGDLTVNGVIDADASMTDWYSGSGGSVWLTAARLVGSGAIRANGGSCTQYGAGTGGRVSVKLASATDFSEFSGTITAYGGCKCDSLGVKSGEADSSPGTVYRETAADGAGGGTLTIANYPNSTSPRNVGRYCVSLPSAQYGVSNELKNAAVVIERWGAVRLDENVKVRDVLINSPVTMCGNPATALANLQLNGHVLSARTKKHSLGEDESVQVSAGDGGRIDWFTPGLMLIIR